MAHRAKKDSEWKKCLRMYANKEFSFSTGGKPRKGSHWDKELKRIEECPAHEKPSFTGRLTFAPPRRAVCTCGYHRLVSSSRLANNLIS